MSRKPSYHLGMLFDEVVRFTKSNMRKVAQLRKRIDKSSSFGENAEEIDSLLEDTDALA